MRKKAILVIVRVNCLFISAQILILYLSTTLVENKAQRVPRYFRKTENDLG